MKGQKLTSAERAGIVALMAEGKGCRQIMRETGFGTSTISRIARAEGHDWGTQATARAQEVRLRYDAAARAEFAAELFDDLCHLRKRLRKRYRAHRFGGASNDYSEHILPEPDADAVRSLMTATTSGMKTLLEIARFDSDGGQNLDALDEWLKAVRGL